MVVGLGNPGRRYGRTRHNVGFMVAEEILHRAGSSEGRVQESALVAVARLGESDTLVVQPQTYMNLSGASVSALARRRGIEASEILVIYDDADLDLGVIRIRREGSAAGHKGLISILESVGTRAVPRVRLGIGKDEGDLADRVLAPFGRDELPVVEEMIARAADAVELVATQGLEEAMNKYNRRGDPPQPG